MLTELVSNSEEKCAQYWPVVKDEWVAYDSVQVHMTEENQQWNGLDITHRKFYVLREVSSMHTVQCITFFRDQTSHSKPTTFNCTDGAPTDAQMKRQPRWNLSDIFMNFKPTVKYTNSFVLMIIYFIKN